MSFPVLSALEELQWPCLVTLFIASVVTVLVYLAQCLYSDLRARGLEARAAPAVREEEVDADADALLNWALSLKSWRCQWRRAWVRALNERAASPERPVHLMFEEDGPQSSELVVSHVTSFKASPERKNVCCQVIGDRLQFSLCVSPMATTNAGPLRYNITVSPLQLQLDLQMREAAGEVQISWALSHLDTWDLQMTPSHTQSNAAAPSIAVVKDIVRQILCEAHPMVLLTSQPAQGAELKEMRNKVSQVASPPKPPRAHDWKLLVKNIRATITQEDGAAGSMNSYCVLQLDDPPQRLSSPVSKNSWSPSWDQPFIFELSGRSKELKIQLLDEGKPQESSFLGEVAVPFDLVKKQPKGLQIFTLMVKDHVTGSLSTELTYLEPSEVRSWQTPTPTPAKKVEMDRTVMPCGTVVTTITAVKCKPGRPSPESPLKAPCKTKLAERRVSEQQSLLGTTVNKALSSSDTELLMLNGTDPVAEAALRQLHESAKQKMKSPVKKSTIIISGVAKTPLSQDDELALMAGYAAAMDASMGGSGPHDMCMESVANTGPQDPTDPVEGPSGADDATHWDSRSTQDADTDKKSALSLCVSETGSKKGKEETSANQKLLPSEKLPAQECQAVLSSQTPTQGPGYESVSERPGVPGAAHSCGQGTEDRNPHSHCQQEAAAQEQEQS
ncbi:C2 domain-containing protein 2 isoform X2 [Scleropages formosus]|uniref:C2 domain-containing protein 2 isoform X2 n=1 Tax=Scleropages formosus TaxID=113540 RepID=UPI0010FA681F|nr:C2 domain-containing protein 2 isoform X2 [Scleropages formosus]